MLGLLNTYSAKTDPPLHVSLNNSAARSSFKNLYVLFGTSVQVVIKWVIELQVSKALHSHIARLLLAREKLRKIWKSAEKRMLVHTKIHKYRDKAIKVRNVIYVTTVFFRSTGSDKVVYRYRVKVVKKCCFITNTQLQA